MTTEKDSLESLIKHSKQRSLIRHDLTYWYVTDREQAFREMMKDSNGTLDPTWLRNKIDELYRSVGA